MCGIVGLISKHGNFAWYADDLFTNMLRMDSIRGKDSTGVFGLNYQGHVDFLKGNTNGYIFTESNEYEKFHRRIRDYRIVVGHNRKATVGSITAENAHPFQEKHIIMVHNGSVEKSGLTKKDTEVDSHAIAHALAEHDAVTALGKLNGAYALVWFDAEDKTLNLARNSQRPLSLIEYPTMWVISSEIGLPLWLQAREGRKHDRHLQIPTDKIVTFNLKELDKGFREVPYEEYKSYRPLVPTYHETKKADFRSPSTEASVVALFKPQGEKKSTASLFKAGDICIFKLDDSKPENNAEILIGHPVFDDYVDENILVRTVVEKDDDVQRYFGLSTDVKKWPNMDHIEHWKGKIQYIRNIGGVPCVFVEGMTPVLVISDAQGQKQDLTDVTTAIAAGCSKCKSVMTKEDVPNGIVRKRGDGTWRIVCPKCLTTSMEEARKNNPQITTLRQRVVS